MTQELLNKNKSETISLNKLPRETLSVLEIIYLETSKVLCNLIVYGSPPLPILLALVENFLKAILVNTNDYRELLLHVFLFVT